MPASVDVAAYLPRFVQTVDEDVELAVARSPTDLHAFNGHLEHGVERLELVAVQQRVVHRSTDTHRHADSNTPMGVMGTWANGVS